MTTAPAPSGTRIFRTPDVPAAAALARGGAAAGGEDFAPAAVEQALAAGSGCVILWERPETALAADLHAGRDPGPGLAAWEARAAAILALFRRNRSRIVLVNSRLLVADLAPERLRLEQRLAQWPDLRLAPVPPAAAEDRPFQALADLIAALAVPRLAALQAALSEIEISSFTAPLPAAADMADLHAGAADLARLRKAHDGAADRTALLLAQIAQMEAQLREGEGARARLRGQPDSAAGSGPGTLAAQYRISAALEKRLVHEAERAVQLEEQADGLRIAVAALQTQCALLEADNRKFLASQSWRMTAPLRSVRRALQGSPRTP